MMAEAYVRNRERCKTECPTPSYAAYVLCHNTEACGGENAADAAADALASGRLPGLRGGPGGFSPGGGGGPGGGDGSDEDTTTRRKLLFGAPGMDGIADAGISPDLVNEIESSSLEAASPCTACKITRAGFHFPRRCGKSTFAAVRRGYCSCTRPGMVRPASERSVTSLR
jgi:hypothetical protein